jgi:hypothetical protein
LSGDQLNQFSKAYEEPVAVPENVPDDAACRAFGLTNQVQENFPYSFSDLVTNPRTIMNKHFFPMEPLSVGSFPSAPSIYPMAYRGNNPGTLFVLLKVPSASLAINARDTGSPVESGI